MRCGALMREQSEGACGGSCARWARAGRGASLAVRLKAYPDTNLFRGGLAHPCVDFFALILNEVALDKSEGVVKDEDLLCSAEHRVFRQRLRTKTLPPQQAKSGLAGDPGLEISR